MQGEQGSNERDVSEFAFATTLGPTASWATHGASCGSHLISRKTRERSAGVTVITFAISQWHSKVEISGERPPSSAVARSIPIRVIARLGVVQLVADLPYRANE
jgi:hypothetical protein